MMVEGKKIIEIKKEIQKFSKKEVIKEYEELILN